MNAVQLTFESVDHYGPQLQVVENKVYYTYAASDGNHYQIFYGRSNLDGSDFYAVQLTSTQYDSVRPQLQVVGNKIYYVYMESNAEGKTKIWLGRSDLDGSSFSAVCLNISSYSEHYPQFQIVGETVYYVFRVYISWQQWGIYTAIGDVYGNIITAACRWYAPPGKDEYHPQLQVTRNRVYYFWAYSEAYFGWSNLDGSGFSLLQLPISHVVPSVAFAVHEDIDRVYFVYCYDYGGGWIGLRLLITKLNGDLVDHLELFTGYGVGCPQIQLAEAKDKLCYVFTMSMFKRRLYTALSDLSGDNFVATLEREIPRTRYNDITRPQQQVISNKGYYVWMEKATDSSFYQIWFGTRLLDVMSVAYTRSVRAISGAVTGKMITPAKI